MCTKCISLYSYPTYSLTFYSCHITIPKYSLFALSLLSFPSLIFHNNRDGKMPSSCLVPTHVVPMEFPFRLTLYMSMFQKISPVLDVLAEILILVPMVSNLILIVAKNDEGIEVVCWSVMVHDLVFFKVLSHFSLIFPPFGHG